MVNCPREVVGAVLKYMGASYNTTDLDSQVSGGRNAVEKNLASLMKQVLPVSGFYSFHALYRTQVYVDMFFLFGYRLDCSTVPTI